MQTMNMMTTTNKSKDTCKFVYVDNQSCSRPCQHPCDGG